jgi:dienelactone hydrolase
MWSRNAVSRTVAIALGWYCWGGSCAWAQEAPSKPSQETSAPSYAKQGGASISTDVTKPDEGKEPSLSVGGKPVDHIPQRQDMLYEDWRKPELTPGMQSEAMPIDREEGKEVIRELMHVQWRELDPIDLWVIRPAKIKTPPVILYLYSYPSSNDRYKDRKFCEFLARNGFAAVGFVPAMTEHRFHDRPTTDWFVSQLTEALGTSVHDVQMALNYLASRHDFDMDRVGMWGDGAGATIAIAAAAVDPRIKVLDLLDPWGDWPNWLAKSTLVPDKERETYLKPDFLKAVEAFEPVKNLPRLKTQQVRIQHIDSVTVTPAIARQHIEAAAPANATIVHYESSRQFFKEVGSQGTGFDWLKEQLGPNIPMRARGEATSLEAGNSNAK